MSATEALKSYPSFRLRYNLCKYSLSESETKVAEYFLQSPEAVYLSITEVAKNVGVGYGSVNRFCQRLGCSGFQEFKILLAYDLALFSEDSAHQRSETLEQHYNRITDRLFATKQLCGDKLLDDVACLLDEANHVLIGGIGGSAPAAIALDYRLQRIGLPCTVLTDPFMFGVRAASLTSKDVIFVINFSGATKTLIHAVETAKQAQVRVVVMTNFIDSPMAELADYRLLTAEDRDPLSVELHSALPAVFLVDAVFERLLKYRTDAAEMVRRTFSAISDYKL